jgi:hypothetical protein
MAIQILKTNLILALLIFNIAFSLYITIKRKADPVMPPWLHHKIGKGNPGLKTATFFTSACGCVCDFNAVKLCFVERNVLEY